MTGRNRRDPGARGAIVVVAAALVLGGCATKSDIRELQTEVREELRAQAVRQDSLMMLLTRATASTQDTLRTQGDQLVDFRGDITRLLQSVSQSMQRLEALVGENQRGIAALRSQGVGGGGVAVAPGPGGIPSGDDTVAAPGGSETLAGVGGGSNAEELYGIARDQHQRGSLSAAQQAYEQFLEEYPNHPLAADAQFFMADILEQQDRPEDALQSFLGIPSLYPTASRVPEALYRAGILQADLGQTDEARSTLQRLMNTYPDSGVALLAREKLEELG
ncbi:MAG: tetratricopeptide repeat protein [Gemmatimonadota bacterium]|jgi:tol-pal system protein YbgF